MKSVISFQLPSNLNEVLDEIAKLEDRSKGSVIRKVISDYVQDYLDLKTAQKRSADNKKGKSKSISLEALTKKYQL